MRRLTADHGAEGDDAGVAARLRQGHRGEGELEGSGDRDHRDRLAPDARTLELVQGAREELTRQLAVEARDDDAHGAAVPRRLALDDAVAVRDPQFPGRVLGHRRAWQLVLLG